jgi:hypothetical protein
MNNPCEKINDKIADYVLGILNEDEIAAVDAHIKQCSRCKGYLEALQNERKVLLQLGENIDSQMDEQQNRVIEALEKVSCEKSQRFSIFKIFGNSRITKFAAAAVVAIALLVPLSFGMSNIVKMLIAGSVERDEHLGDFSLGMTNSNIRLELEIGNKNEKMIVSANSVRFFVENDELRGTLRCRVKCLPKYKWMTTIELLDAQDKKIASTQSVNENAGINAGQDISPLINIYPREIHFSLGSQSTASQAHKFRISVKQVSETTETTPDAWIDSSELTVVHGKVTGLDGKPIANAVIQIRQKKEPGMSSIAAEDVITDKQGFYSYDAIGWPYNVGVIFVEPDATGQGYNYQYKRLNKYFEGSQIVDFKFGNFPTGSSAIFGKAENPDGQPIKEIRVRLSLKVDFTDFSTEYLNQFGYDKPFITEDGSFELSNLPAGIYDVALYPTKNEILTVKEGLEITRYVCDLKENQKLEIGNETAQGKFWYGRVLFEDGSAAVPELKGFVTQIVKCQEERSSGMTIATVEKDGYFRAQITDETMEQLKSGQAWLTVRIGPASQSFQNQLQDERLPVGFLSSERGKAGAVKIKRPSIYYGRILYENGKPAVPEVIPWPDADVWVTYTPKSPGQSMMQQLCKVDKEGYFAAYFTDEEIEQLKTGEYAIWIYHPSYEWSRSSYHIDFPYEMLSTKKESVKGYEIVFNQNMKYEYDSLHRILESIEKLKGLFTALTTYANSHQRNYPASINLVDINDTDLQWFAENVEYFSGTKTQVTSDPAKTVLAYDKTILKAGPTLVLFKDGHIEYCWPRDLEILGIKDPAITPLP